MEPKVTELQQALRSAEDRIHQLETHLKTIERQRDRFASAPLTSSNGRELSVAQWYDEVKQFMDDYQHGPTYPAQDVLNELERLEKDHEAMQEVAS